MMFWTSLPTRFHKDHNAILYASKIKEGELNLILIPDPMFPSGNLYCWSHLINETLYIECCLNFSSAPNDQGEYMSEKVFLFMFFFCQNICFFIVTQTYECRQVLAIMSSLAGNVRIFDCWLHTPPLKQPPFLSVPDMPTMSAPCRATLCAW